MSFAENKLFLIQEAMHDFICKMGKIYDDIDKKSDYGKMIRASQRFKHQLSDSYDDELFKFALHCHEEKKDDNISEYEKLEELQQEFDEAIRKGLRKLLDGLDKDNSDKS